MEKYRAAGQATNDNVGHAIACLTRKAKNTHSEYVILTGFPMQKIDARTHINVTLYAHYISRVTDKSGSDLRR